MSQMISMKEAAVDSNTAAVTASLDLAEGQRELIAIAVAVSGTQATRVLEVQVSPNDSDWAPLKTTLEITAGAVNISGTVNARFVRLKVKTLEGGASVEDIYLNVK